MADAVLPVVEHFHSIQGEGVRVGEPATFIRLAGCNLRCVWCDTPYSWSPDGVKAATRLPIADVAVLARERAVVITGGEPMLHRRHLGALIDALRGRGVAHVTVETNATLFDAGLIDAVDLWSLSPKLPASGEPFPAESVAQFLGALSGSGRVQLKFVCADPGDDWLAMWEALAGLGDDLIAATPILVQPDGTRSDYDAAVRELAELVIADDEVWETGAPRRSLVRVVPQVHRVAWGAAARGV